MLQILLVGVLLTKCSILKQGGTVLDDKLLKKLLANQEGTNLDFKSIFYDIKNKDARVSFIKDVLSMANSSVTNNSYILCGVSEELDKTKTLIGINKDQYIDDSQWRQIVNRYSSHPINFDIVRYLFEDKLFVIIKIHKEQVRPIFCSKNERNKLVQGTIYFRNGSCNDIAKDLVTIEHIIQKNLNAHQNNIVDPTYNNFSKFPTAPYYKFIGRQKELEKIKKDLIYHHKNYICSLLGEGGVGKTSIAYKLACDIKDLIENGDHIVDDVIWISAKDQRIYLDSRTNIEREFNSLEDLYNKILAIFYEPKYILNLSIEDKLHLVDQAMNGSKFLFILDNLELFSDSEIKEIHDFIKNTPVGHKFLLTSRHDIRVQDFIPIEGFDEENCKLYLKDIISNYEIVDIVSMELFENFNQFYKLTKGNALYSKFFIAQIKKGRTINEILNRKGVDCEKDLKEYCFDSTLKTFDDSELNVMYALAICERMNLTKYEISFVTNEVIATTGSVLQKLSEVSLISTSYNNGNKIHYINPFLKSYLIEENRIPKTVLGQFHKRSAEFSLMNRPIDYLYLHNFGLHEVDSENEIVSYNITLDLAENINRYDKSKIDECLKQASLLYPGNYIVPFIDFFNRLKDETVKSIGAQTKNELITEFITVLRLTNSNLEKIYLNIWLSILFMMLTDFEESLSILESIIVKYPNDIAGCNYILDILCACNLTFIAKDHYEFGRLGSHDDCRNKADAKFEAISTFMEQPYFYYIKSGVNYAFKSNCYHLRKEKEGHKIDLSGPNLGLFSGKHLF